MAKKIFKGNSPKNARVKIDYSGVKPNVTFSYPSKKHQVNGSMFFIVFVCWFIILIIGMVSYGFYDLGKQVLNKDIKNYSCEKNVISVLNNESFRQGIVDKVCGNAYSKSNSFLSYLGMQSDSTATSLRSSFSEGGIINSLLYLFLVFIPPFLIYFPFKKHWINIYPKYQAWWARKKVMTFSPKQVRFSDELGYYCEVPVFSNVILDFNAKKDFSKYLRFMEIEEYKFKFYTTKSSNLKKYTDKERKRREKRRENRKKKKQLNEWFWYARFYFSQKPKQGKLVVLFK